MYRYKLPITIIIVNNGGIYGGFDAETFEDIRSTGDLSQVYVVVFHTISFRLPNLALTPSYYYSLEHHRPH